MVSGPNQKRTLIEPAGKRLFSESARQFNRADHARAIVIGLHGVTGMRLHKELARFGVRSAFGMDNCRRDFESLLGSVMNSDLITARYFLSRGSLSKVFFGRQNPQSRS
jgi:hypothetical protein